MEKNKLKIIDKEYLENTIIDLDKNFLSKKYTLKSSTQSIENKIKKIVGEENFDQLNNNNIDDIIGLRISNINKISKYFITMGELPNPNVADEEGLYIILDENSIEETCKFFVCTVVKENNLKKWAIISSPSPILETENIDFEKEFKFCENKQKNINKYCFKNFEELRAFVIDLNDGRNGLTTSGGSINGLFGEFYYKNGNKVKEIQIIIVDSIDIYSKLKEEKFYKKIDDAESFSKTVINPNSQQEPEEPNNDQSNQNEEPEEPNNDQSNQNEEPEVPDSNNGGNNK